MTFSRSYSERSGIVFGFHGTDASLAKDVVLGRQVLEPSNNSWDWIGHGIYFWEHSPSRAFEFARTASRRKHAFVKQPAVIGAVLDLGYCLDLLDYQNLGLIREAYNSATMDPEFQRLRNKQSRADSSDDLLLRDLDCAVIENIHKVTVRENQPAFDSVKAVFWEGNLLYPNAGFREKNHIQICVRNPNCIKGFFLPIYQGR